MEVLKFLESIRTPFGDTFFSLVTHLGEETIFIVVGLLFFWCLDKKKGYFIYGNHTQDIGDAFMPNMFSAPQDSYIIVHANNVSMPFLGRITPSLGALPLPEGMGKQN